MYTNRLEIHPKQTAIYLWSVVLFLVVAHSVGLLSKYYLGHSSLFGLVQLFDLGSEMNIPTLFSIVLILLCSALLSIISIIRIHRNQTAHMWIVLTGIFLFLAVDEFCFLHERLSGPSREFLGASGLFFHAWIVPYGLLLALLGIWAYPRNLDHDLSSFFRV